MAPDYGECVPKFWITYTEAARYRHTPFRPDHMVPADRYVLNGDWLIFTVEYDGAPRSVLEVRNDDVARIERIEDWQADQRKGVESEAYRKGLGRSDEFDDRFLFSTYADDQQIHIFIPGGADRWVSERLWWRLVALGQAYHLHLLPSVPGTTEPQFLNAQQVSTLSDEVLFLTRVVRDALVADMVAELVPLLAEAQHGSAENALGIECA